MGKVNPNGSTHSVPKMTRACNIKFHNGFIYQWGGMYDVSGMNRFDLTAKVWE